MSVHSKIRVSPHQVPGNLIQMLCRYAEERSDQPAFIYLLDGQSNQAVLTYAQLEQRARAIAAHLQNMGLAGQRVLLVYPPGLDFITAFFGCLYAGCVAVPTYPPHRHRMLNRFHTIAADAGAGIALSTSSAALQFQGLIAPINGQADTCYQIRWLATDEIPDVLAERWSEPAITSDTLAMLQYTSGSTSQPKGVMISHANLIDNTSTIHNAFGIQQQHGDSGVFWLPTYHDMGLVGGVLVPMFAGGTNVPSHQPTSSRNPSPGWPLSANTGQLFPAGPISPTTFVSAISLTSSEPPLTFPPGQWPSSAPNPFNPQCSNALPPHLPPVASNPAPFIPATVWRRRRSWSVARDAAAVRPYNHSTTRR